MNIINQWNENNKIFIWYGPYKKESRAELDADNIFSLMKEKNNLSVFVDRKSDKEYIIKVSYNKENDDA
ncbi:MAG: hypothetical protein ACO20M_05265 [Methylophilaceae bacterium]